MFATKFASITATVLVALNLANAGVLPAGKCVSSKLETVSLNYKKNADMINWKVIYAIDMDPFKEMDYFLVQMAANPDNTYNETDTIAYKNSTTSTEVCRQTYVDNIIVQDGRDSSGAPFHFHLYPLNITSENAVLYCRCSESGGISDDTRFIAIPEGGSLSDDGLKQLMDTDAKYGFRGSLIKLPYAQYTGS